MGPAASGWETPPAGAAAPSPGGPATPPYGPGSGDAGVALQSAVADLKARVGDPVHLLREARSTPLRERPQSWFDTVSILGGAVSGYVWFTYGSIRGMPRPQIFGVGRESWFDLVPSGLLIALPFILFIFRQQAAGLLGHARTAFTRLGIGAKLVTIFVTLALAWWVQNDRRFFVQREGLDFITPLLMAGIPIVLVMARGPIDRLLMPLQPLRRGIPLPVLVGIGLAIPTAVSFLLYYMGYQMYPYLRASVLIGTLLSYAVVRTPVGALPAASRALPTMLAALVIWLICGDVAWADDFLRDPFNLNDGLRTNGAAQVLASVATTVVSILVNGTEVARVVLQSPTPTPEGEKVERKNFQVLVDTTDARGALGTTLEEGEQGRLYVYANCVEVGKGPFPAGDATIRFNLDTAQEFVTMTDLGTAHGRRCALLQVAPQLPATPPPATFSVTVTAGAEAGGLISATIPLQLKLGLQLVAKVEGEAPGSDGLYTVKPRGGRAGEPFTWEFHPLLIYFRRPEADTPVRPEFIPLFSEPEVEPKGILELDAPRTEDSKTWRIDVRLRKDAEITDEWLFSEPVFHIQIKCQEGQEMGGLG